MKSILIAAIGFFGFLIAMDSDASAFGRGHGVQRSQIANLHTPNALPAKRQTLSALPGRVQGAWSSPNAKRQSQGALRTDTIHLADPTIFLDGDTYYLYGTSSNEGFLVYQSKDLIHWGQPAGKNKGFALLKGDSYGTKGFWAPQVFKRGATYYMAYTANEQLAIAHSNSPLGPFKQDHIKPLSSAGKQIDPFVYFDPNGKVYLYHVRLSQGNRIFVSELKPDLSDVVDDSGTECISATEPWENTAKAGWPVAEGPTVFKSGKTYYMLYSANDYQNPDYAVGYATAATPAGPWKKFSRNPILNRTLTGINGTGHGDLFTDKKGNWEYVFHTHNSNQKVSPRATALIPVQFKGAPEPQSAFKMEKKGFRFLLNAP